MKTILTTSKNQQLPEESTGDAFDFDAYILKKETDENLKKLANAMAAEWACSENKQPDLSFSRFEAVLKSKRQ